ncbi:hypothetical protein PHYSODRAFT_308240 [Phytophthora sojae]|uniref:Uncharacterized protein n=1 Tax=Phytophthora sojae (strain P6497) TaxID=1094619 RepID=G5AJ05_PHYSP|nr:hypothetical protein PHYSODRAFT_308240 [Phytophthora sojae]EGZ04503.1 hypothetical protein PHYSODRAFT_308240 [Phytophthora sojae]|eukprot:XP_009540056.1 hypothetical protein PHYSODRAFT_308240 [Phytophthora sojae]
MAAGGSTAASRLAPSELFGLARESKSRCTTSTWTLDLPAVAPSKTVRRSSSADLDALGYPISRTPSETVEAGPQRCLPPSNGSRRENAPEAASRPWQDRLALLPLRLSSEATTKASNPPAATSIHDVLQLDASRSRSPGRTVKRENDRGSVQHALQHTNHRHRSPKRNRNASP